MSEPEIVIPPRDWGDDEPAPAVIPTVIVSSRDGYGDPGAAIVANRRAPWRGLAVRAAKAGWTVRTTYALAHVPDTYYLNGNLRKHAHYVHTIALRLVKGAARAAAVWARETFDGVCPGDEWACDMAMMGRSVLGLRAWTAAVMA